MTRFILRRLISFPVVLLLANFFGYTYAFYVGPVQARRNPFSVGNVQIPPLIPEYIQYLRGALSLNFGITPLTREPIAAAIGHASVASLVLLSISLALSVALGLFLGFRAVHANPPRVSSWLTLLATVGLASPGFYIGLLLISLIFLNLTARQTTDPLLPVQGYGLDAHLILPTLALMARPTVQIAQVTSGLLAGELGKQYVTAALSFGHSMMNIRRRLAFRNILAPVALTVAGSLRLLVAQLIIIEWLFNWPGLGRLASTTLVLSSESTNFLYPPLIAALLMILVAIFYLADLAASTLARTFDPRYQSS